jgi:hypothetical protein
MDEKTKNFIAEALDCVENIYRADLAAKDLQHKIAIGEAHGDIEIMVSNPVNARDELYKAAKKYFGFDF